MSFDPQVTQMWSQDGFSISTVNGIQRSAKIQTGYQITAPANYTVEQVRDLPGLPATGSVYPNLPTIFMKEIDFTKHGPTYWTALAKWHGEFGAGGAHIAATAQPPEVSWTDIESEEEIDEDLQGNAIVTANLEPIEGVTMKIADLVVNIRRKFEFFNPAVTHAYRHSVSSDTFLGFSPGVARLTKFSAKQAFDQTTGGYWDVSASIQFRYAYRGPALESWYSRVRHEGFYERVRAPGPADQGGNFPSVVVEAVDKFQQRVSRPVLLDEQGFRVEEGQDPVWLRVQKYQPLPYNSLGLI